MCGNFFCDNLSGMAELHEILLQISHIDIDTIKLIKIWFLLFFSKNWISYTNMLPRVIKTIGIGIKVEIHFGWGFRLPEFWNLFPFQPWLASFGFIHFTKLREYLIICQILIEILAKTLIQNFWRIMIMAIKVTFYCICQFPIQ